MASKWLTGRDLVLSSTYNLQATMFFLKDSLDKARALNELLIWFEVKFGLIISMSNSKICGIGRVDNLEEFASVLGCVMDYFPTSYL